MEGDRRGDLDLIQLRAGGTVSEGLEGLPQFAAEIADRLDIKFRKILLEMNEQYGIDLQMAYIGRDVVNAFAVDLRYEWIFMYAGLPKAIWNRVGKIIQEASFLPLVGRADRLAEKDGWFELPSDPTRSRLAIAMFEIAILFVFYHECGHLNNGHCKLLKQKRSCSFIDELGMVGDTLGIKFRQAIEYDADCYGSSNTITTVLKSGWIRNIISQEFISGRDINYYMHFLFGITRCAFQIVFDVFSGSSWRFRDLDKLEYPPSSMRLTYINSVLIQAATGIMGKINDELAQMYFNQAIEIERILKGGPRFHRAAEMMKPFTLDGADYLDSLEVEWVSLRPKLTKLSRSELAPVNLEKLSEMMGANRAN